MGSEMCIRDRRNHARASRTAGFSTSYRTAQCSTPAVSHNVERPAQHLKPRRAACPRGFANFTPFRPSKLRGWNSGNQRTKKDRCCLPCSTLPPGDRSNATLAEGVACPSFFIRVLSFEPGAVAYTGHHWTGFFSGTSLPYRYAEKSTGTAPALGGLTLLQAPHPREQSDALSMRAVERAGMSLLRAMVNEVA